MIPTHWRVACNCWICKTSLTLWSLPGCANAFVYFTLGPLWEHVSVILGVNFIYSLYFSSCCLVSCLDCTAVFVVFPSESFARLLNCVFCFVFLPPRSCLSPTPCRHSCLLPSLSCLPVFLCFYLFALRLSAFELTLFFLLCVSVFPAVRLSLSL